MLSSRASYVRLLESLWALNASAGGRVALNLGDKGALFDANQRLGWLAADLAALHRSQPAVSTDHFAWVDSSAAAAGMVYVVEGSSLGGQVLAKMASAQLGLTGDRGARYLTGYGAETANHWLQTQEWLDEWLADEERLASAEQAAVRVFETYGRVLQRGDCADAVL